MVLDMLETMPANHGFVETVNYNVPECLQAFDNAAFPGAIVANKHRECTEPYGAAVAHSLEGLQSQTA